MIFLVIHILLCLIYIYYKVKTENRDTFPMALVVLVPIFGFAMWVAENLFLRFKKVGDKEFEVEKLKVTDEKYRRLLTDMGSSQEMVPLEDAFVINDSKLRRSLLLDILHKNPEEYLGVLERASGSEDVEVTHYATTTLLEIQSEFEQRLQEYKNRYETKPHDRAFLLEYSDCLKRYVDSGLIDGTVLSMQQEMLLEVVDIMMQKGERNREDAFLYIETAMDLKKYDKAKHMLDEIEPDSCESEVWNRLAVRYYWEMGQRENIDMILQNIAERKMYLTKEGKEWFKFWSKGKTYEKTTDK